MKSSLRQKFTKNGYITIKKILSNEEKKIIKNIIYENFKKYINFPNKNKFNLEDENFHKKLILFRKKKTKKIW